jgi:putative tricarboxylic transport membrane protein
MMMLLITAIFLGIVLGLIVGMLPGVGNITTLLAMFPILLQWPPEVIIIFYAVLIQTSNFTSSVSALNFGLLGDITSEPALRERSYIVKNKLIDSALKFSAIGSTVAVTITLIIFSLLMEWISLSTIMLRSETKFLLIWIILIATIWWPKNNKSSNVLMVLLGTLLGSIGHHYIFLGSNDVHILTFGITEIYGGIPMVAVLTAFLAVPAVLTMSTLSLDNLTVFNKSDISSNSSRVKFNWSSTVRGSFLGAFLGMVPVVGTMICSNVAWTVENLFSKNRSEDQKSLNRLVSAESANNSAAVTVLIPLLLLGIAIIPSEMLLLSIVEILGWRPDNLTNTFYYILYAALILSCIVSYLFCYTFVIPFSKLFYKNFKLLMWMAITIMISSVYYVGSLSDNQIFFLFCFSIFSIIVLLIHKYFDFIPLVAAFLLADECLHVSQTIYNLYF